MVSFYYKYDIPVYATFLDASNAYDQVDHHMRFKKMILCNIPLCLVRLLCIGRSVKCCALNRVVTFLIFLVSLME